MKQVVMKKWVEALRSGEYQRSGGALRNPCGYCALGVLCDLYIKETNKARWSEMWEGTGYYGLWMLEKKTKKGEVWKLSATGNLPMKVQRWSGVKDHLARLPKRGQIGTSTAVSALNDNGHSFQEIADSIEVSWRNM